MLDMMMSMQRASLQAVSAFQPFVSAFLDSSNTADRATRAAFGGATHRRPSELRKIHETNEEQLMWRGGVDHSCARHSGRVPAERERKLHLPHGL
jgi:hypothetical protein